MINKSADIKKGQVKKIENHLKNYKQYKTAIKVIKNQLEYLMPELTTTYKIKESEVVYTLNSENINCILYNVCYFCDSSLGTSL